jgi:hypothetical protein
VCAFERVAPTDEPGDHRRDAVVCERTVEANLTRAYRKLGVRSRAQLARRLTAASSLVITTRVLEDRTWPAPGSLQQRS